MSAAKSLQVGRSTDPLPIQRRYSRLKCGHSGPRCPHRVRPAHGWGVVRMSGRSLQGFNTSLFSWCRRVSEPRHGGVAFVMEFSAGGRVAGHLSSNAVHCSWNARRLSVHGRRCRDAGITAASFHSPVAVVAFNRHPSVRSGKSWRRLTQHPSRLAIELRETTLSPPKRRASSSLDGTQQSASTSAVRASGCNRSYGCLACRPSGRGAAW